MRKELVYLAISTMLFTPLEAIAQDDQIGIAATITKFPPVTVACISFDMPVNAETAKKAVDEKRKEWVAAAYKGGLKKYGYPFVDAKIEPPAEDNDAELGDKMISGRMCGVVEMSITAVAEMSVYKWAEREGTAGYCLGMDVEICLRSAFKDSGFTESKPWPRLPVYARWDDSSTNPVDVDGVVFALSRPILDMPKNLPESNETFERNSGGLQPIEPCPPKGCDGVTAADEVNTSRVGWFIEAFPPPPAP
ncbi:hypothetical protein PUR31_12370 [Pseudomonas mosselii]|uniref:hypothetical protein n=1 Tax=unclassified Pseudomonas TaxID=196821 RepID=UPI0020C2E239|nr:MULTISPECIES: hypothetical protein [unclassified Pseudomonas]MCP8631838.1 hypothetical protein [Pseudomonas sp. DVZ6]MDD7784882.1 hypothetical protein [Pseudomonas sp. DVZ24]